MALAAALMLVPKGFAQDEHEQYYNYPDKSVGINKYLKSNIPDADGKYTLRLEMFTTGSVEKYAVPTDFVLVLDCSGSMLFDCLFGKRRPESLKASSMADPNNQYYQFLRPAHTDENVFQNRKYYSYNRVHKSGNLGDHPGQASSWGYFESNETNSLPSLYYYYAPDQTYYKLHRATTAAGARVIYFTRSNNSNMYLICTQNGSQVTTTVSTTAPAVSSANNDNNDVILIGYPGDNIYRPISRREALSQAVQKFIQGVADHNVSDHFYPGVTKHQVAIVSFGGGYTNGEAGSSENPSIAPSENTASGTRVVRGFHEINTETAPGTGMTYLEDYKGAVDKYFGFYASTYVFLGVRLAKLLLQDLQQKPGMAPLDDEGHTQRNKVVVVFTDGEPSDLLAHGDVPPSGTAGNTPTNNAFNNVQPTLADGVIIKTERKTGTGSEINGKIFTIDLAGSATATTFLEHLSSDYPLGKATSGQNMASITYSGSKTASGFYMDANAGGLDEAFTSIVEGNTGDTSAHILAVDVISDSFELPEGIETSGEVKLFTSQCIGIDENDEYLLFTDDVAIDANGGTGRPALEEIWFNSENAQHEVVWTKKTNYDVDADISYVIDGKKLIFKGFDFANLWCGHDGEETHNNTRQISSGMKNYDRQNDGYRGFRLVAEFPIVVAENAVGGPDVPTNKYELSGLFPSDDGSTPSTTPIVNYPKPALPIPIRLVIQKTGLKPGESASFTVERKLANSSTATWDEFTTFVLTGNETATDIPEVRLINLDPRYHYRVKESGWSWAYENADPSFVPSTEDGDRPNPIVFENDPIGGPKHAEAKAVNKMRKTGSQTNTVYDKTE